MEAFQFVTPGKIICQKGGINLVGELVKKYGSKPLICIGGGSVKKAGYLEKVIKSIEGDYAIYEGIPSDPVVEDVKKGAVICADNKCDVIVAMGGGSVIDCAKAVGLVAANGGSITDYEFCEPEKAMLPLIAIPTTAGTASEVTKMSIITDTAAKKKMVINTEKIMPLVALLDAEVTCSMPAKIAAATGMDALTHCMESYLSDKASPMTKMFALKAVELISKNIHSATYNPNNMKAKEAMLLGQMYAGLGFSNTSTALVHSMSRPLGVYYGIPHGEANAVLLATVMEYNMPACTKEMAEMAKAMGIDCECKGDWDYAKALIKHLYEIHYSLPLRRNLAEMGVKEEDIRPMAESGFGAASTKVNPRKPTVEEMVELYKKLM